MMETEAKNHDLLQFEVPHGSACKAHHDMAAMSSMLSHAKSFSPNPSPGLELHHCCSSVAFGDEYHEGGYDQRRNPQRYDLSRRSFSFPTLRSWPPDFVNASPNSHFPRELSICKRQQESEDQEEPEEIVEVQPGVSSASVNCRRSRSLKELFNAEKGGVLEAYVNYKSSSAPCRNSLRSSSSTHSRVTLRDLLHSEAELASPHRNHLFPSNPIKRGKSLRKSCIQSTACAATSCKQLKQTRDAEITNSTIDQQTQNRLKRERTVSQLAAKSLHKEELPKHQETNGAKADRKPAISMQMPWLQRSASQTCRSTSMAKYGGWGKPVSKRLTIRSSSSSATSGGSAQAALTRQLSSHEQYYISRKTEEIRLRRRTSLPYREHLLNFCNCFPDQCCCYGP